jgi:hypothetical protein
MRHGAFRDAVLDVDYLTVRPGCRPSSPITPDHLAAPLSAAHAITTGERKGVHAMQTYTFVFDQPENEDQDQPHVVAEGDGYQEAEIRARDYLRESTEITSGFRRTLIFRGAPLTPKGFT